MKFDEELINKIKNEIDFNKTKSQLLIELINKMGKVGTDLKEHFDHIMKSSKNIKNEIRDFFNIIRIEDQENRKHKLNEVVAIDGSSNIGGQLSGKFVSLYSVAQIHLLKDEISNIIPSEFYWGDMEIIDALDEKEIEKKLEVKMIKRETKAYKESLNLFKNNKDKEKIVFIDGPIIDPPFHKDVEFIKYRTKILKELINKNVILIGCVKRIYGNNFCKFLLNSVENESIREKIAEYLNDSYVVSSLFANFRRKNNFHGSIISNFYQNKLPENSIKFLYEKNNISIKSLFFQFSTKHRLMRIDIPILTSRSYTFEYLYEKVRDNLIEWSYPGIDLPYPVHLAHEFSKIRNGCAKKIYDDILTKNLSNKPENQLFINMLK